MATEKVGIYRKYHGPIPQDKSGQPLPKREWPRKRAFRWVVRWFGDEGRRYSRSFKTRKEAERFAETKRKEVEDGRGDPPPAVTLREFAKEHERVMSGQVASETLYDQLRALRAFQEHLGDNRSLATLSPRDGESFVAARLRAGVKPATVNKDIRTLRRVFNLAIDPRGYLPPGRNPFSGIKQRKVTARPVRYVSPSEFHALLNAASDPCWKALISLAYTTAARKNELLNLTWDDVDFERNQIRIVSKQHGEALPQWEPKDREGRTLPVPESVMQRLADLQASGVEGCPYVLVPAWRWRFIQRARDSGDWEEGNEVMNNVHRRFQTLRRRAKVARCTLHDLRRTCITNWARSLPIHVAQKLAGHSDIKTTQRYYLAVEDDELDAARSVTSRVLGEGQTDPKLTHSAEKSPSAGGDGGGAGS